MNYKVIVIGPTDVGKTSMCMKQKMGFYDIEKTTPSTEVTSFVKEIALDDENAEEKPDRRSSVVRSGSMR
jgi:GTPase SAR1 family protein